MLESSEQTCALAIARRTLEVRLHSGRTPDQAELPVPEQGIFHEKRAVFVTLKNRGELRGCIGHILPAVPLWKSIRDNAISAALNDYRFPRLTPGELDELNLEISVLTPPRDIPGPDHFEVGRHGILMACGGHRAVFLPQVAPQQGWDRETTLGHLSDKAGLGEAGWRDPCATFQVFEAQVFAE